MVRGRWLLGEATRAAPELAARGHAFDLLLTAVSFVSVSFPYALAREGRVRSVCFELCIAALVFKLYEIRQAEFGVVRPCVCVQPCIVSTEAPVHEGLTHDANRTARTPRSCNGAHHDRA